MKLAELRSLARSGAVGRPPERRHLRPAPAGLNDIDFRMPTQHSGGSTLAWGLRAAPRANRVGELYLHPGASENGKRLVVVEAVGNATLDEQEHNPDVLVGLYDLGRGWVSYTTKADQLLAVPLRECEMCKRTGRCEVPVISWNGIQTGTDPDALCGGCLGLGFRTHEAVK